MNATEPSSYSPKDKSSQKAAPEALSASYLRIWIKPCSNAESQGKGSFFYKPLRGIERTIYALAICLLLAPAGVFYNTYKSVLEYRKGESKNIAWEYLTAASGDAKAFVRGIVMTAIAVAAIGLTYFAYVKSMMLITTAGSILSLGLLMYTTPIPSYLLGLDKYSTQKKEENHLLKARIAELEVILTKEESRLAKAKVKITRAELEKEEQKTVRKFSILSEALKSHFNEYEFVKMKEEHIKEREQLLKHLEVVEGRKYEQREQVVKIFTSIIALGQELKNKKQLDLIKPILMRLRETEFLDSFDGHLIDEMLG